MIVSSRLALTINLLYEDLLGAEVADGFHHPVTTKRDLHLAYEVLSLIFLQNLIDPYISYRNRSPCNPATLVDVVVLNNLWNTHLPGSMKASEH